MSITRPIWLNLIEDSWKKRPIVWLAGVRRTGKTTLSKELTDVTFLNCDLPTTQARLEDPESFYKGLATEKVVFDEIHRLRDPAILLKIGADQFPKLRLLATGSSTLVASKKFSDTLTGRKRALHFVPVLPEELPAFSIPDLRTRLLHGGLPQPLMEESRDSEFYAEWLDSFYARDIQELYSVDKRQPFLKVLELLLSGNGSLIETTNIGKQAGLSRPTVVRYLEILEATHAISILRPFSGNSAQELVHQPKVYGFDTGFVCFVRGWQELRPDDCGTLLENLTLESLQSLQGNIPILYWRTKQKQEIDFIVPLQKESPLAIECKWKASGFSPENMQSFRQDYPAGSNIVVCSDAHQNYKRQFGKLEVKFMHISHFRNEMLKLLKSP